MIDYPAGDETRWDWAGLPDPPPSWGQERHAHLLAGALSRSGGWRGVLAASFAEVAKYYGAAVDVCPSRRGWRKGVVEKANHSAAQRWWRTLPDHVTPAQALVAWHGNSCSVPPGHGGQKVTVRHQLGTPVLDMVTAAGHGHQADPGDLPRPVLRLRPEPRQKRRAPRRGRG